MDIENTEYTIMPIKISDAHKIGEISWAFTAGGIYAKMIVYSAILKDTASTQT